MRKILIKVCPYEGARDRIRNGDIIFVRGSDWASKIIRFVTNSPYSHVGIAFWVNIAGTNRLMIAEAHALARRRILNLSFYSTEELDIVQGPLYWEEIANDVTSRLGQIQYGWLEATYVGFKSVVRRLFNIDLGNRDFSGEICSEFVAKMYKLTNTNVSPQRLFDNLVKSGMQVHTKVR